MNTQNPKPNQEQNHHIIIRHFKTHNNKIDYTNSYKESIPYINFIKKYISKFNINEIEIRTSPLERTLITSLILYIKIKDMEGINVHKPRINRYLERDPSKQRVESILKHFKSNYKTGNKLVINITHSSVYSRVFTSLMTGMSSENVNLKDISNEKKIHAHSLSFLTDTGSEIKYGFNLLME
jgi:hypothetical protein